RGCVPGCGAPTRHQDFGRIESRGEDRLGSYEGEDPRGPEAAYGEADFKTAADHAGDSGSLEGVPSAYLEDASGLKGGHAERLFVPAGGEGVAPGMGPASAGAGLRP